MVTTLPPPLGVGSDQPDSYTAQSPDFTGEHAEKRILHINTKNFRYGTDDKTHAAALVLSALLLFSAVILAFFGVVQLFVGHEAKWLEIVLTWIGNAFLFTSGVAVGKASGDASRSPSKPE